MAPINGKLTAALLGGLLLLACLASDGFLANSMLTLPFVAATLVSAGVLAWGVPKLRSLKLGQVIREDGPQGHLNKAGTPTMGGLLVVPVGLLIGGWTSAGDPRLLAVAAVTLAFMAIGAIDDWRSLTKRRNTGLSPAASWCCRLSPQPFFWFGPGRATGWVQGCPEMWDCPSADSYPLAC